MNWLLPLLLVFLVGVLMAAAHFVFVRWMQRSSEPVRIREADAGEHPDA